MNERVTSKDFLRMSREDQILYGHRVAEQYRDEVILPRGGCGYIWRNMHGGTGSYACEREHGHPGPHRNGQATCGALFPREGGE